MSVPKRPSVCVVGSGWHFTSGISYYTHRLTEELSADRPTSALLLRRLIPRFLYPGRSRVGTAMNERGYRPDIPVYDGVDWFWVPSLLGGLRFLRRQRPDIILFQWWTGAVLHTYLALSLAARLLGCRVVVEFHETQDTGEAGLPLVRRYVHLLGRYFVRSAAGLVAHSEHDRTEVARTFAVDPGRVAVIPHGPFDHHTPEALPESDDSRFTLLFFGTIRPYKGLEYLVEAFDSLTDEEVAGLHLLVVGEPWENWTLPLQKIRDSRHGANITLVDRYVHDREVTSFFARADAVVLPYLRSSASGPLHIAMANGLPVVLSDVGGLRTGAEGYEGVVWVPPRDSAAIADAIRKVVAMRGTRFTDSRSWADTVERYGAVFAELQRG